MSRNLSLVVGVEEYRDTKIGSVNFAAADANAVAAALNGIGFAAGDQKVLVNAEATLSDVRYYVRSLLGSADKDDTVFLFFSGHGFSEGNKAYLVVNDSRADDMVRTTVPFHEILTEIEKSSCERIALFLDCCHSGLRFPRGERSILRDMDPREIAAFFRDSTYRVAFSSCRSDQKSYSSNKYKHGVWTYHLLQALKGEVPEILEKGRYLRAAQLQDYLAKEVPPAARDTGTDRRTQTPVLFGMINSNFLIGDLEPVLPKPQSDDDAFTAGLDSAVFKRLTHGAVRSLSGFAKRRGHFLPDRHSDAAERFIVEAGSEEVAEEAKDWYKRIQDAFAFKRREITLNVGAGSAIIKTALFDLSLSLEQHRSDPAKYSLLLQVDNFSPDVAQSKEFNAAFADAFTTLIFSGTKKQDIVKLIDRIEDAELPGVDIDFPEEDPKYVSIRFKGHRAEFVVGKDWLKVKLANGSPNDFIEALHKVQSLSLHGHTTLLALADRPSDE